jgi:hypothetical protein
VVWCCTSCPLDISCLCTISMAMCLSRLACVLGKERRHQWLSVDIFWIRFSVKGQWLKLRLAGLLTLCVRSVCRLRHHIWFQSSRYQETHPLASGRSSSRGLCREAWLKQWSGVFCTLSLTALDTKNSPSFYFHVLTPVIMSKWLKTNFNISSISSTCFGSSELLLKYLRISML